MYNCMFLSRERLYLAYHIQNVHLQRSQMFAKCIVRFDEEENIRDHVMLVVQMIRQALWTSI